MATPPRLCELECPACSAIHWVIDCDFRGIGGPQEPYSERQYTCPRCGRVAAGFRVHRKSPPGFLIGSSVAAADAWEKILSDNFPEHHLVRGPGSGRHGEGHLP